MIRYFGACIVVLSLSLPAHAYHNQSLALFTGALAGSMIASNQYYSGIFPDEIEDWKDWTKTTANLGKSCDTLVETRLLKGNRRNFVFVGISNTSARNKVLLFDKMEFLFGSGKVRFPDAIPSEHSYDLKPGWYVWGVFPFPRKTDFKDENSLTVKLPLRGEQNQPNCIVQSSHQRLSSVPVDMTTYLEYTGIQISVELGASAARTGNFDKAHGKDGDKYSFLLKMDGFPTLHHGSHLLIGLNQFGAPNRNYYQVLPGKTETTMMSLGLGYTYRDIISKSQYYYLFTGAAFTNMSVARGESNGDPFNAYFASIHFGATYDYVFASVFSDGFQGEHSIGLTLFNTYMPPQQSEGLEMHGLNSSLMLRYSWGY